MYSASEKLAIIRLVEDSGLSVRRTLDEVKVSRTSFYRWYAAYEKGGLDGLSNQGRVSRRHWNRIPDAVRSLVVEVALDPVEHLLGGGQVAGRLDEERAVLGRLEHEQLPVGADVVDAGVGAGVRQQDEALVEGNRGAILN